MTWLFDKEAPLIPVRMREPIKTALAMVIAYGIALYMDWPRPYWAAFAVAVISFAPVGQSFNKAAMRLFGTLLGVVAGLALIAFFPQDRWWFMIVLSLWVGFCTYMSAGRDRQYFWTVSGFVTVIICMDGGVNSIDAFGTAVVRALETGVGILSYSVVASLIWPQFSGQALETTARELVASQRQRLAACYELMQGRGAPAAAEALAQQEMRALTKFGQLLDAAQSDTYEVWALRQQWRRFEAQARALMQALATLHESMLELRGLDVENFLPQLQQTRKVFDHRFELIEQLLATETERWQVGTADLTYDRDFVRAKPQFEKAAAAALLFQLREIDRLTTEQLKTTADIRDVGPRTSGAPAPAPAARPLVFDLDRLVAAARVMVGLWLVYLAFLFVPDLPGGAGLIGFFNALSMFLAIMPHFPVTLVFMPMAVSVLIAGTIYIAVLPHLTTFLEVGTLIFLVTFLISYMYSAPQQALGRIFGLVMFATVTDIQNDQVFSFIKLVTTALMVLQVAGLLWLTSYIPVSARPEKAFLRYTRRFFRSADFLIYTMSRDPVRGPGWLHRSRIAFHQREVATLPSKLASLLPWIDTKALPGTTRESVEGLTSSFQALSYRLQEQMAARRRPQSEYLVGQLTGDIRPWRQAIQAVLSRFADDPSGEPAAALRLRLDRRLATLTERVASVYNDARAVGLKDEDFENFYRLLGAFRGVSEAVVEHARLAETIDWPRWQESRF